MKLAIKITGCSDPMLWYADKIGEVVPFVRNLPSEGCYLSREPAGYTNIVRVIDGELIELPEDNS